MGRCDLPGHLADLHFRVCFILPAQSLPPWAGAGSVHVLDRDWLPSPHVTEQELHAFQADQFPSTSFGAKLVLI